MAFTFNLSACFDYDVALCVEYINFFILNKGLSQKLNRLRPLFMMHIFIHHMFMSVTDYCSIAVPARTF